MANSSAIMILQLSIPAFRLAVAQKRDSRQARYSPDGAAAVGTGVDATLPALTCAVEATREPPTGSARPPRQVARKFSATALNAMLLAGRAKPWPSSGKTM